MQNIFADQRPRALTHVKPLPERLGAEERSLRERLRALSVRKS
jgi:hypothetical protein